MVDGEMDELVIVFCLEVKLKIGKQIPDYDKFELKKCMQCFFYFMSSLNFTIRNFKSTYKYEKYLENALPESALQPHESYIFS